MRERPRRTGLQLVARPDRVEASLWRRLVATGDARLRRALFERYQRYAKAIARRQGRKSRIAAEWHDDLDQLAYRGLLEAIDRFDPHRGTPFPGFAIARISGSVIDGMGAFSEDGAQSRHRQRVERERVKSLVAEQADKGKSALEQLSALVTELALGLMVEEELRRTPHPVTGHPESGFDNLAWRQTQAVLAERVSELPEAERAVIRYHYLDDLLFTEIAKLMGLSRGRVSQLHRSALSRLHKSMRVLR